MGAVLEVKYFNTFWLKKIKSVTETVTTTPVGAANTAVDTSIIQINPATIGVGAGQTVTNLTNTTGFSSGIVTVIARSGGNVTVTTPLLSTTTSDQTASTSTTLTLQTSNSNVIAGMKITGTGIPADTYIVSVTTPAFVYELNQAAVIGATDTYTYTSSINITTNDTLTFTGKANGANVPGGYVDDNATSWYEEESRIRGGYNNLSVDFGVKAYLDEEKPLQQNRFNSLIYSGIFNSRTGVNQSNQFSVGEEITRSVDPVNGSIQKLYAEDTNLIIFQESKVSQALIDKDAIYSAEGGGTVTSSNLVIGAIRPLGGTYGISRNPESFAIYGFRKYFTDKDRGVVLRLSRDGLTEISNYGMTDYFRDQFGVLDGIYGDGKAIGGFDIYTKQYVLSLQQSEQTIASPPVVNPDRQSINLSFDERVLGFPSLFSYQPDQILSVQNNYYTFKDNKLYKHYDPAVARNNFYGVQYDSSIQFVFNPSPSLSKVFKTVNYEGSNGWEIPSFNANRSFELRDTISPILSYNDGAYVGDFGYTYYAGFDKKEGKYMTNLVNASTATEGEVVFGNSMTGVKGYIATVTIKSDTTSRTGPMELFAVSSNYIESAY